MNARFLLMVAVLGCSKAPPDAAVAARPVPEPLAAAGDPVEGAELASPEPEPTGDTPGIIMVRVPDPDVAAMARALSVHDPEPGCAEVEALSERPVEALLAVVEQISLPSAAPLRAARCVVTRHAEEAPGALVSWVTDDAAGLAELVLEQLDTLPLAIAVSVVEAGLAGPHADRVAAAVEAAGRADLEQLAATP